MNKISRFTLLLNLALFAIFFISISGCNKDEVTSPTATTEDEYITNIAIQSTDGSNDDDNEVLGNEVLDFSEEGAVFANENELTGYDSLKFYGRRVTGTSVSTSFTVNTDTLKTLSIKRTITGNFIIKGYIGGSLDSTVKPYSQEQFRTATFKRIARSQNFRLNWRLLNVSAVDGQTITPELGKSNITMSKIEFYKNGNLLITLNGPDFTSNLFTTRFLNGNGIMNVKRNDNIRVKVFATSNQSDTDIVAFHWSRNAFGFHRIAFGMTSQVLVGSTYERTYEKTFTIYALHRLGVFNAFISASTRSSLWNNNPNMFSSTYMGVPYRVSAF